MPSRQHSSLLAMGVETLTELANAFIVGMSIGLICFDGEPLWLNIGLKSAGVALGVQFALIWRRDAQKPQASVSFEPPPKASVTQHDRSDLSAFIAHGLRNGSFSRRTFLPENAPHFMLPSGEPFGRQTYYQMRVQLIRMGVLDHDGHLAKGGQGGQGGGQAGSTALLTPLPMQEAPVGKGSDGELASA